MAVTRARRKALEAATVPDHNSGHISSDEEVDFKHVTAVDIQIRQALRAKREQEAAATMDVNRITPGVGRKKKRSVK